MDKRIARDLAIITDGMREWRSQLEAALAEGLESPSGQQRREHVQLTTATMTATRLRLMQDVGALVDKVEKARSQLRTSQISGLFGFTILRLRIVLPELVEPIRRYLQMVEQYPSMRKEDPEEDRLQRHLQLLLTLGESAP